MALNLDVIGEKIGPLTRDYTWKDVVLYALGVGAGFDELHYVYEDRLKVIPSFSIASNFDFLAETAVKANVDLSGILHGEQDIIFHNPIPVEGGISTQGRLLHFYDKGAGKGALVVSEADTFHDNGQKLYTNIFTLFCRKDGGFGGDPGPDTSIKMPEREPDFIEEATPGPDQPLLYRLSGDIFTLHVDPEFAKASGFEKPIMHGLCTHGFACRAVIKHLMPGQPERMTRFKVRFSKTLYPGETIKTLIWKEGEGKALFRTVHAASGQVILDMGQVEWISAEELERRQRLGGIRFDGRVAVVTGAGAGLGRDYALTLGELGAKVVVNDLGSATDGSGASASAADKVVAEIKAAGGEAVANYDSVATAQGGAAIIQTALTNFGRVDIVINNAGILRDKSFAKMEEPLWDAVLAVHLNGAYNVTRPAFLKMKEQGYGRIIFTTSAAGLYGNFGQTNYSAAKLGLVGLMNTLKLEGESAGIKVNTIAPIAGTRLTEGIIPPELFAKLKPEFVSPLVLYLAGEGCQPSGEIFNLGGGYFNRAAFLTSPGAVVGDGKTPPTLDQIHAAFAEINQMAEGDEYGDATSALTPMLEAFEPKKKKAAGGKPAKLTPKEVFGRLGQAFKPEGASGVELVYQFSINGEGGGEAFAAVSGGAVETGEGKHPSPTTTIKMSGEDFLALVRGELNAMSAFTSGKLKIEGDLMKSQLIEKLFDFGILAGGGGEAAAPQAGGEAPAGVPGIFARMESVFVPEAAAGLDIVFGFAISGPGGGDWHAVIKDGACRVAQGAHPAPTTTIKMSDADFLAMMNGELNPMAAFTSGKLKIDGDLMKSQLIQKLFKF